MSHLTAITSHHRACTKRIVSVFRHLNLSRRFLIIIVVFALVAVCGTMAVTVKSPIRAALDRNFSFLQSAKPDKQYHHDSLNKASTIAQKPASVAPPPAPDQTTTSDHSSDYIVVSGVKWSPDPASQYFSTTPPPPPPTDINITITQPNQVPAGTIIVRNTIKEDTVYYGGDLVFSVPEIVFHRTVASVSDWLTVSTPDGGTMMPPSLPWYVTSPSAYVSFDGPSGAYQSSWQIQFSLNPSMADGTYQAHIFAYKSGGTGTTETEYDGFITIEILE
jgi:hypothetical protein